MERGARERLVPILMTAMAAGLALIPLALGGGKSGSEIQTPMAIVILCGLMTSTLLNMVVVPTLYLRYGGGRGVKQGLWSPRLIAERRTGPAGGQFGAPRDVLHKQESHAHHSLVVRRQRRALRQRHRVHRREGHEPLSGGAGGAGAPPAIVPVATVKQIMDGIDRSVRNGRVRIREHDRGRDGHTREATEHGRRVGIGRCQRGCSRRIGQLLVIGDRAVDQGDWVKMSRAMSDAGMLVLKATDAKDAWVLAAGEPLNASCDDCHNGISGSEQRYEQRTVAQ